MPAGARSLQGYKVEICASDLLKERYTEWYIVLHFAVKNILDNLLQDANSGCQGTLLPGMKLRGR